MVKIFVAFKPAAANPQKGDAVAVFGIQVGMDLKDESAELIFIHVQQRASKSRGRVASGAMRIKVSSISFTPKLLMALPKKTGATLPAR